MRKIAGNSGRGIRGFGYKNVKLSQLKGWNIPWSAMDLQPIHLPGVESCGDGDAFRSKVD